MTDHVIFYLLVALVAFLYASVGHGGASGYLALMALFSVSSETMRGSALLLNIFVSLIAFIYYYQAGHFKIKLFIPFAVTSIPAAFIGGLITIDSALYKKILAAFLLFAAIRIIAFNKTADEKILKHNIYLSLAIGALIGFFSGMIGIGGGIILSPLLILLHWANMKQSAAVSALFIFVNSMAGFSALFMKGYSVTSEVYILIIIAIVGGLLGAYFGAKKFDTKVLKPLLALVLLIASIKLIIT
jgi:uncharacterized membrane protein YfcA